MRKPAMLSLRPLSPRQALRGSRYSHCHTEEATLFPGRALLSCLALIKAGFDPSKLLQAYHKIPLQWQRGTYFSFPLFSHQKVTGSGKSPTEQRAPGSPASQTSWATNSEIRVWGGKKGGGWQGKPFDLPFCKNSTWMALSSTEGFRSNSY